MREDESLYADISSNDDTLGYRFLKGLQLPIDCPVDKPVALAAHLAHDLALISFLSFFLISNNFFYSFLFVGQQLYCGANKAYRVSARG